LRVVTQLETSGDYLEAGQLLYKCERYKEAVSTLLRCTYTEHAENPAIDLAILAVKRANSDTLTHKFIDYLMGLRDGVAKVHRNLEITEGREIYFPTSYGVAAI
jgi:hypothetical protein